MCLQELKVSRDVIFDELKPWYVSKLTLHDEDIEEAKRSYSFRVQDSLEISGPSIQESSSMD